MRGKMNQVKQLDWVSKKENKERQNRRRASTLKEIAKEKRRIN